MNITQAGVQKPLRLWPGVTIVVLQWLIRFALPTVMPDALIFAIFGGMLGGVAIILWWLFFSRAPWPERLGISALLIAGLLATRPFLDKSIATAAQGMLFPMYAIPVLSLAFVASVVASRNLSVGLRRVSIVGGVLLGCGVWTLVRTGGFDGSLHNDFAWRWSKTPEERLVASSPLPVTPVAAKIPAEPPVAPPVEVRPVVLGPTPVTAPKIVPTTAPSIPKSTAYWPGFRGPGRDSVIPDLQINTDWSASPPVQLWRRPIGPGWSSFAVNGDLIYTQEQRGDEEIVTCYNASNGNPVWAHRDAARFWESNAGAGPRGTPTLHQGRLYTFGATGIVNALNASDGSVVWSRNAGEDTKTKIPGWGFASSPLVVGDLVIVAASGKLVAYDAATGAPRWFGPPAGGSYSSPHLLTIDGVEQIALLGGQGVTSVTPADGKLLWKHSWASNGRIMQPAVTAEGDLLISAGDGSGGDGMRRIAITHGPAGWTTEERWTSIGLKPNFNDFVVYDGYVFGFSGGILACVDAKDGKRKWKGGRYGSGQFVLLRDQGVLLVLGEDGGLALVKAAPDQFTELAKFPAIDGKTWNHPVLAGDRLYVRNGEEMMAFRLSLMSR